MLISDGPQFFIKAGVSDTETESDSGTCSGSDLPLSIGPGPEFVQAGASDTETEEEEESIDEPTFWYPNQGSFQNLVTYGPRRVQNYMDSIIFFN